jgi:hypothetical protein
MNLLQKSIIVCVFIHYLESITQSLSAYSGLDNRELPKHIFIIIYCFQ